MQTPEQWPKIKEIVGAALERGPGERPAFLDQACVQKPGLRAEVESLLAAHADAGGLSASPWIGDQSIDAAQESKTIGPYQLIRILGVGGMGQVWLAEQTEPVRRRVALKLIRAGMYNSALIKRFQSERQSLAIMEHPAIARVFDTGTTSEGQPYFAMEYVDGLPITEYCDSRETWNPRTPETVHTGVRRRAARPSKSHHPSRPETFEHISRRNLMASPPRASSISVWRKPRHRYPVKPCSPTSEVF